MLNRPIPSPHTPHRPTFSNPRRTGAGQGCGKSSRWCEKQVLARACPLKASRPVPHPSPREGLRLSAAKCRVSGRGRGGDGAAVCTPRQRTPEERSAGCVRSPALSLRTPLRVPYLLLSLRFLLGVVPGPGSLWATRSRYQEARRRPPGLTRKRGVQARLGTGRSRGACVAAESHALAPPFLPLGVSQSQRCLAETGGAHTPSVAPHSSPPPPAAM